MGTPRDDLLDAIKVVRLFNGYAAGVGTDAESALDDMLFLMQDSGFDVSGLEGQIKEGWEPSTDEGDGENFYYHFGIIYGFEQVSDLVAQWDADDEHHYVKLMKNDNRYYCDTSLGYRNLDAHIFDDDADAIWYMNRRVTEGNFDPPPLVWRRV